MIYLILKVLMKDKVFLVGLKKSFLKKSSLVHGRGLVRISEMYSSSNAGAFVKKFG